MCEFHNLLCSRSNTSLVDQETIIRFIHNGNKFVYCLITFGFSSFKIRRHGYAHQSWKKKTASSKQFRREASNSQISWAVAGRRLAGQPELCLSDSYAVQGIMCWIISPLFSLVQTRKVINHLIAYLSHFLSIYTCPWWQLLSQKPLSSVRKLITKVVINHEPPLHSCMLSLEMSHTLKFSQFGQQRLSVTLDPGKITVSLLLSACPSMCLWE